MSRPLSEASRASLWRALTPALSLGIVLFFPVVARAEPHELRSDVHVDAALALGLVGAAATLTATEGGFAPSRCRWCDEDAEGRDTRNAADRAVRAPRGRPDTTNAARVSDIYGLALVPASMIGMTMLAAADERAIGKTPVDLLIVSEAVGLAVTTTQITKFLAARQRPYVHELPPAERDGPGAAGDRYFSFFSGHSAFTFALATSAGTVASLRGYRAAPFVWGVGLTLAASTAYLRIAADKHYFTDVLVGILVGSASGLAVPLLHGRVRGSTADGAPRVNDVMTLGASF